MNWLAAATRLEQQCSHYVIVTLIGVSGSTPRDSGTKMVVSIDSIYDSIGGGHLEHKVIKFARKLITTGVSTQHLEHFQLGIHLDQCCGGSANVLFECFADNPVNIMVFGAGHVGKALIPILASLPCQLTWVDSREAYLIENTIDYPNLRKVVSETPAQEVLTMPANSYFIVLTHKHQLDFDIIQAIVKRADFEYAGLIGSKGKWQRFKNRFKLIDIDQAQLDKISCPIGKATVKGKLPTEVAVSIAAEIIEKYQINAPEKQDANIANNGVHLKVIKKIISKVKLT